MNVEQMRAILAEYPPSMRLVVVADAKVVMQTTIVEMSIRLISEPPDASLCIYGRSDCILRERDEGYFNKWLEMDMR
jgi:hypothetical protein